MRATDGSLVEALKEIVAGVLKINSANLTKTVR